VETPYQRVPSVAQPRWLRAPRSREDSPGNARALRTDLKRDLSRGVQRNKQEIA